MKEIITSNAEFSSRKDSTSHNIRKELIEEIKQWETSRKFVSSKSLHEELKNEVWKPSLGIIQALFSQN